MNYAELAGLLQSGWHKTEIITNANGQVIYQGRCSSFTGNESQATWMIKKITMTEGDGSQIITEQFADGDIKYDNIWDNRASLTYKYA